MKAYNILLLLCMTGFVGIMGWVCFWHYTEDIQPSNYEIMWVLIFQQGMLFFYHEGEKDNWKPKI